MAHFGQAGWHLAFGNAAVFAIVCGIVLAFGDANAVALMG